MKKEILLPIKAKHANEATGFVDTERCPVARAASEFFDTPLVAEGVTQLYVGGNPDVYNHESYGIKEYKEDKIKAAGMGDETVIRLLLLTKNEEDEKVSGI